MNLEAWIVAEGYALDEITLQDKMGMEMEVEGDYITFDDGFVVHVTELRVVQDDFEYNRTLTVELDI